MHAVQAARRMQGSLVLQLVWCAQVAGQPHSQTTAFSKQCVWLPRVMTRNCLFNSALSYTSSSFSCNHATMLYARGGKA